MFVAAFLGLATFLFVVYCYFCIPDNIKDFNKYDGINFDYTLEENDYIDKLYYKQLSPSEARHYRCMYHAAINNETNYYIKSIDLFDLDEASKAILAFGCDYPEYYWFGDTLNAHSFHEKDKLGLFEWDYIEVSAECYNLDEDNIVSDMQLLDNKMNEILPSFITEDSFETIKNVYDYVVKNVVYDIGLLESQDYRSALFDGKGVCASYAEMFQIICNRLGFECYSVQGDGIFLYTNEDILNNSVLKQIPEDSIHEWNIICIDGLWYWVDPTWADSDEDDSGLLGYKGESVNYDFFLVPDEIFLLDHTPDISFIYPGCLYDYYYLYNNAGIIMNEYDENVIKNSVVNAFRMNLNEYSFHFTNPNDVESFIEWVNNKGFYNVYGDYIYPYYSGNMEYIISTNCSVKLRWSINNL